MNNEYTVETNFSLYEFREMNSEKKMIVHRNAIARKISNLISCINLEDIDHICLTFSTTQLIKTAENFTLSYHTKIYINKEKR